jgi:alpha-tubulin suppressor-like RCC1 family protein
MPVGVEATDGVVRVIAGARHACGIRLDGTAVCWGANRYGQLGNGMASTGRVTAAVDVLGGVSFVDIGVGVDSTCGVSSDGRALCWGFNGEGQLGDGTTVDRLSPTAVVGF